MKKNKITKNDLKQTENDILTSKYWEFQLGVGLQYEYSPEGVHYSVDYPKIGKEFWKVLKYELYELLCSREAKTPKEWLNDLITGDIRNLTVGITTAITAKYDITLGIALPAAALVIKTGILKYCSEPTKKPQKNVRGILDAKKNMSKKKKK